MSLLSLTIFVGISYFCVTSERSKDWYAEYPSCWLNEKRNNPTTSEFLWFLICLNVRESFYCIYYWVAVKVAFERTSNAKVFFNNVKVIFKYFYQIYFLLLLLYYLQQGLFFYLLWFFSVKLGLIVFQKHVLSLIFFTLWLL